MTTSEKNNSHFVVEHSFDGVSFNEVGRVGGHGTTNLIQHYEWLHVNPSFGANYYRLKQVDFNADFAYSQTVFIEKKLNELTQLFIYPNPASEIIIIHYFSSKGGDCTVQITDIAGRVLLQQEVFLKIGENSITFPLTTIQKGNYRITIRDSEKFSSELLLVE